MIKISKYSIAKIIPIVAIFVVFSLWYFILDKKSSIAPIQKDGISFNKDVFDFVSQLKERWEFGDIEGKMNEGKFTCKNISKNGGIRNPAFFQCNSAYMSCFLSGGISKAPPFDAFRKIGAKWLPLQTLYGPKGSIIYKFTTNLTDKILSVKLDHYCHQTYLPPKVYSTGLLQELEYAWDNYGQEIYIDKNYVNRYEVKKWLSKNTEDIITEDGHLPALNLSLVQMKKFCSSRGKKLLQNHIFDAASFFPSVFKNGYLFKSIYPWGNTKKDPTKILSISWNGVENILGGEMEVFDNLFSEKRNLKASSNYLPVNHFWHKNGLRAYWQGESFSADQFDFLEVYSERRYEVENQNGVAFRCMLIK